MTDTTTTTKATLLLKIGSGWAVCTRTAVPIILARFDDRQAAYDWQCAHEARIRSAA